ncbi:hypothetical protein HDIA_1048 [Hartmannibacter diazotrophicus]|uniref:DUF2218 domain-containing protein n=1 Tax=Hartmannibacter diazotrophicus TaxID=1482074 RepID=A0A2C9D321_9HYPH|nr:DUF2218 domain-containing protein [Hartmannibacter diazotrophicus]SON54589.1 hypothetical protein HDIA_1048 [Hartmannibacter diazotrophicus]
MNDQTSSPAAARSTAEVPTASASKYLQQLCKHFQHKVPATFNAYAGRISFPAGDCDLSADDGVLKMTVTAKVASDLAQLQDIVDRHLVRFAFREELKVVWQKA